MIKAFTVIALVVLFLVLAGSITPIIVNFMPGTTGWITVPFVWLIYAYLAYISLTKAFHSK